MNTMTISMATALPRTLAAELPCTTVRGTSANTWAPVSPLMTTPAAVAPRHNSIQNPIHAVRVRAAAQSTTAVSTNAAVSIDAVEAGFGRLVTRKQSCPPRGTPH